MKAELVCISSVDVVVPISEVCAKRGPVRSELSLQRAVLCAAVPGGTFVAAGFKFKLGVFPMN